MQYPCGEQKSKNIRYEHKYIFHQHNSRCPNMHIYRRHKKAKEEDVELQILKGYSFTGWPLTKEEMEQGGEKYWPTRHELTIIDGKHIITPYVLQRKILEQLPRKHMVIENACFLTRESVYQINMNADVEQMVKKCSTCLEYQCMQPCERALHYEIPFKPS